MEIQEAFSKFMSERTERSRQVDRFAFSNYTEWFEGSYGEPVTLSNWTTTDIRNWLAYMQNVKKLSPATINTYRGSLAAFCNWCVDNSHMLRTPFTRQTKGVKKQPPEVEALDRNQENKLYRLLDLPKTQPIHRFIIIFLLNTGLRSSELANLKLSDISIGENELSGADLLAHLPESHATRKGVITVRNGKGNKDREIPLNATAREALLTYLKTRPNVERDRVLISPKFREPVTDEGITYTCRKFRTAVPNLHPHLLRSTFASKLIEVGVHIDEVARLLGHDDPRVTYQRYVKHKQGKLQAAVETIG